MRKLKLATVLTVISTFSLTACQQVQTLADASVKTISQGIDAYDGWIEKGHVRLWGMFENESLRDTYLMLEDRGEGKGAIKINPKLQADKYKLEKRNFDAIFLEKYVGHYSNFSDANRKIDQAVYISEKDLAAQMYIDQARKNGNEVRIYKSGLNRDINNFMGQAITKFDGAQNRYNADPAFVEFDKNGSPVSFMTRSWQTISAIGVDSRIYTNIYFGKDAMRIFENRFGNKYLEDNLIRVIK